MSLSELKRKNVWFVMILRDLQDFEQVKPSGLLFVSQVKQNEARGHFHSVRPLEDVGGFKAVPLTVPQKAPGGNTRGMMVYLLAFPFLLSSLPCSSSLSQLSVGVCGGTALCHTQ